MCFHDDWAVYYMCANWVWGFVKLKPHKKSSPDFGANPRNNVPTKFQRLRYVVSTVCRVCYQECIRISYTCVLGATHTIIDNNYRGIHWTVFQQQPTAYTAPQLIQPTAYTAPQLIQLIPTAYTAHSLYKPTSFFSAQSECWLGALCRPLLAGGTPQCKLSLLQLPLSLAQPALAPPPSLPINRYSCPLLLYQFLMAVLPLNRAMCTTQGRSQGGFPVARKPPLDP